jgi:hypothetical protein
MNERKRSEKEYDERENKRKNGETVWITKT